MCQTNSGAFRIPYERALALANQEKITEQLYPLFVHNIGSLLYHPANSARPVPVPPPTPSYSADPNGQNGQNGQNVQQNGAPHDESVRLNPLLYTGAAPAGVEEDGRRPRL